MKTTILTIIAFLLSLSAAGQTIEQVKAEIHRQGIPHAEIVLAQARLETGNFTSNRCKRDHNLFGMKNRKRYAKYRHWRESVKDYKERISSRYKRGENYYAFLERIGYALDARYNDKLQNIIKTSKRKSTLNQQPKRIQPMLK